MSWGRSQHFKLIALQSSDPEGDMRIMVSTTKLLLALAVSLFLAGCGGGSMPAPTPVGIFVQSTPADQTAYSGLLPPKNQVSFAAYISYSDGTSSSTPISGAKWSDGDNWVSLQGSVATCTQPAPVVILPLFSKVNATAQVNGKTYTDTSSGLYCL
jgi:hypothetical protein